MAYDRVLLRCQVDGNGCWLWQGGTIQGYSQIQIGARGKQIRKYGHRVVWEHERGTIPDGMTIDHLCRVRNCVRPEHMEVVTPEENTRRGGNALKTHCLRGHVLARQWKGRRRCLECVRSELKRYYWKRKALDPGWGAAKEKRRSRNRIKHQAMGAL